MPFILEHQDLFKKDSVVTDSCGIKTKICRQMAAHKDLPFTLSVPTLWPGVRCPAMTTA